EAIAAKTIRTALGAPLSAGFEFAESEQERVKIKDAFWPQRVASYMTDTRQPLLDLVDAERLFRKSDWHPLRIKHANVTKMQAAVLFDDGHVRHQRAIAIECHLETVNLKAEMVKSGGAPRFMQFRTPLQERNIEKAISRGHVSLIGAAQFFQAEMAPIE